MARYWTWHRAAQCAAVLLLLGATVANSAAVAPAQPAPTQPATRAAEIETRPVLSSPRPAGPSDREGAAIRRGGGSPLEGWWQTVLALVVVLGIIVVLRIVLKRFGRPLAGSRGKVVEVLARASVQPRQHLLLVRLGRRLLLLGCSPSGLSTLSVVSDPEEVAELSEAATGEDLARPAAPKENASQPPAQAGPADKEGPKA